VAPFSIASIRRINFTPLQMQPAFDQGRLALADLLLARHRKAEALAQLRWLMQPNNGAAARTPDILLQAHARLVAM